MNNIGHLITVNDISTGKKEFLFLYITGDEPEGAYKYVIQGIRNLRLPVEMRSMAEIQADPVTDFSRVEREHPDIIGRRIYKLPVSSFFDEGKSSFQRKLFLSGVRNVIEKKGAFFPTNRLTAVATGSDFFDREDIIKKIWNHIEGDQNVLLIGPRRYGKTSIMREIENGAIEHEFRPVLIDLESIFTPQEFVARIWVEVEWPDKTEQEKDEKAQEIEEKVVDRWFVQGEDLFNKILKKKDKVLFVLDECPYMLDSFLGKEKADGGEISSSHRENTDRFVKWFREQRDRTKGRCAFLLAGSINLKPYLKDNKLDKDSFSECKEVRVDFFDSKTVKTYIQSLLLGQEILLSDEVIQELVRLNTPGIPYFIQVVMNHVVFLYRGNPNFSVNDLMEMYHKKITGPEGRRFFDTFERHFKRYGSRKPGAFEMLKELSDADEKGLERQKIEKIYTASSGSVSKSEFDIILRYLQYDFYIEKIKGTEKYRFSSPILRDYWQKNQR